MHGNYVYANLFEQNICQNVVIDDPHERILTIESEKTIENVYLYKHVVPLVQMQSLNQLSIVLKVDDLPVGIYWIRVELEGGQQSRIKKVIKIIK